MFGRTLSTIAKAALIGSIAVNAIPTATTTSAAYTATPPADNPYIGYTVYLNPHYTAEISAAVATISDATLAQKAAQVAQVPTFFWIDAASKVPTLGTYLADALAKQQSSGLKYLVEILIYDLPDRDCSALVSNGEYTIANNGTANYKAFINAIGAQISAYPDVRVVIAYEPYSLAILVTNLSVAKCANARTTYEELSIYAWQTLNQPNVYIYVDAGHAGWLGWPADLAPAASLFGSLYKQAGTQTRMRGLVTNIANYNAFNASSPDPVTSGDANYDELHYINALAPYLTTYGFPAHFIVDLSRSGVQNIRKSWGDWCNVNNAGFGLRPSTNTNSSLIDAFVWVKLGGESDGTSSTISSRYDAHCGLSDSKPSAPDVGSWFEAYFEMLVTNANPPFTV